MKELKSLKSYLQGQHEWVDDNITSAKAFEDMMVTALNCPQNPNRTYQHVALVSGGMDSVIMWYRLSTMEPHSKLALYFDLGHPYMEMEKVALSKFDIPYLVENLDMDEVPYWGHIIPGRNMLMMLKAVKYVEDGGRIWLGCVDGESGYADGDKSQKFFDQFTAYVKAEYNKTVKVATMRTNTKNGWLKWYLERTNDTKIFETITCFDNFDSDSSEFFTEHFPDFDESDQFACFRCQACLRKFIAFRYSGASLPETYQHLEFRYQRMISVGCREYVDKYIISMEQAIKDQNFTHYSQARINEDLPILKELQSMRAA